MKLFDVLLVIPKTIYYLIPYVVFLSLQDKTIINVVLNFENNKLMGTKKLYKSD